MNNSGAILPTVPEFFYLPNERLSGAVRLNYCRFSALRTTLKLGMSSSQVSAGFSSG